MGKGKKNYQPQIIQPPVVQNKKTIWEHIKEYASTITSVGVIIGVGIGVGKLSNAREDIINLDTKVQKNLELLELNRIECAKYSVRIENLEKRLDKSDAASFKSDTTKKK